jgi:hypothetical protein
LNPFGRSGPITREEDAVKACARGKEYIHIALLQVRLDMQWLEV